MAGVVVDSGPFIASERAGFDAKETLSTIIRWAGTEDIVVSSIAYSELRYGLSIAHSDARELQRRRFLTDVFSIVPVLAFTREMAEFAADLRGRQQRAGNTLPFADALIAATALTLGRGVLTTNLRDFERIPELKVIGFPRRFTL